jgi:anhydro-N-acetylmuramic acid kinase
MRIVGLMSGTSLDGVDAAMLRTDGQAITGFGPGIQLDYTPADRAVLQRAVDAGLAWRFDGGEPEVFAQAEAVLTRTHADAVRQVCQMVGLQAAQLDLVGFHGQTVIHIPPTGQSPGQTRQIGNAQDLATALGCPVAFDFRSEDVRAGGQGAPLAPAYHAALVQACGLEQPIGVLNIGGVANLTLIGSDGTLTAFDTGPGNGLIDAWMAEQAGVAMDAGGEVSAKGRVLDAGLDELLAHPHFAIEGPKSLDRWDFSLDPARNLTVEDGAATLAEFTAHTVALGLQAVAERPKRLIVCGGGRKNRDLMARIARACGVQVQSAEAVGWRGDLIEAEAFAYLAARTQKRLPISWPGTTGVPQPLTGGTIVEP